MPLRRTDGWSGKAGSRNTSQEAGAVSQVRDTGLDHSGIPSDG